MYGAARVAEFNMSLKVRIRNPCDGCTLRRVKCEDAKPCYQCRARGIQCTTIQTRQKRGPKGGPRHATSTKIREFQKGIRRSRTQGTQSSPSSTSQSTSSVSGADTEPESGQNSSSPSGCSPAPESESGTPPLRRPSRVRASSRASTVSMVHSNPIVMDDYRHFVHVFHEQAFGIWPVVNAENLLERLGQPNPNPETLALAASLCAATIGQLRLEEDDTPAPNTKSASQFVTECLWFRERYDYRETYSTASILIPFFLHIYYANTNKLRTAGLFLRESITYVHAMRLDQPETYQHLDKEERSLRLRIYWLLFISER